MAETETEDVIQAIRAEATSVKQCFTSYSFQALALASTILGISFGAMSNYPNAVYAPLPAIALLMAVGRMGIFKYATANRNHGYELHLARSKRLSYPWANSARPRWHPDMRHLAWEEAVRAWRVVQPTLFRCIYRTPEGGAIGEWLETHYLGWVNSFRPGLYQLAPSARVMLEAFESGDSSSSSYPWFLPGRLAAAASKGTEPKVIYYAGSYLRTVLSLLAFVQYVLLLPLGLAMLSRPSIAKSVVLCLGVTLVTLRSLRLTRRRELLEDELLSIHSCAIVWQAVVMAHFMAVERTGDTYNHYTQRLGEQAQDIARHALRLHDWLSQGIARAGEGPSRQELVIGPR
jgi:hypothetical protein